jgi:uncharacterized cupredoxin-like copper-binding protein
MAHFVLSDFAIDGPETATAGDVQVEAENDGATPHELVIFKTGLAADALPESGTTVDEAAAGELIGKLQNILGGAEKQDTFTLTPGNYVVICNVVGHYRLGMHAAFTVQ